MLPDIRNYIILVLAVAAVLLGTSTCSYRTSYKTVSIALDVQNASIAAQKKAANATLLQLTKQRERDQEEQEKQDAESTKKLADLQHRLDLSDIRVRFLTTQGGAGGGSGGGAQAAGTGGGAKDQASAIGLLPAANSRRLKQALSAVEQLNQAYGSCRAALCKLDVDECSSGG